jgi:hypothetical protein
MSDEENNEKSTEMKQDKWVHSLILCARAHKNVGHALRFLKGQYHYTEQCSSVESMEDIGQVVKLLDAANENLRLLLSHLQLAARNNNSLSNGGNPTRILCQKDRGTVNIKQKPVAMGDRTTHRTLSPERTAPQNGNNK